MPSTYYRCLCGDNAYLALTQPDSFAVRDTQGRDWICHPVRDEDAETVSMRDHVAEVFAADAQGCKRGLRQEGTQVKICLCEDERELPDRLACDERPHTEG